jgi:hypothetical protein
MKARYKRYVEEVESTAALTAAGLVAAYSMSPDFFTSVKEGIKQGRHAGRTVDEMIRGTEGQRAVESLLEQNLRVDGFYEQQVKLVDNLARVYKENEVLAREARRLAVQVKGFITEGTAAGTELANKATGGLWGKVDDAIMDATTGKAKEAREGLPKLQELYRTAREFYDKREKNENTTAELCQKLEKTGLEAVAENKGIEKDLNSMATQLDRTYRVEDHVFVLDGRVSFVKALMGKKVEALKKEDVNALKRDVREYSGQVDDLRSSVEQNAGIPPYQEPLAWLDYGINPVAVGVAGALAVKGLTKLLPGIVERPLRKVLALPVSLSIKGTRGLYNAGASLVGKLQSKGINNQRDSQIREQNDK